MSKKIYKNWQFWVGLFISVAAIAFFLYNMRGEWGGVWEAFARANYIWLIPAAILFFASVFVRGIRWQLCFRHIRKVPPLHLFAYQNIGFMGNSIYPLRAGEILRPYLLSRREGIPFTSAFGTVTVERVFDLVATLLGFFIASWYFRARIDAINIQEVEAFWEPLQKVQIVSLILLAGVLLAGGLMTFAPSFGENILRFFLRFLPGKKGEEGPAGKIVELYHHFADGFQVIRDIKAVALGFVYTFLVWFFLLYCQYCIIMAMGLNELGVGVMGMLFIMMTLALAVAAPQGPAYIGTFQITVTLAAQFMICVGTGRPFSEAAAPAGAFALMLWFNQMIPMIIAGFVSLGALGLKLGELKHEAEEAGVKAEG